MFFIKEREMIANNIFREFFIGVLFDKKNIISDLKVFDMCYSDLLGIKNSTIVETIGNYELDDIEIYIDENLVKEKNNIEIFTAYLYQKRLQIQDHCIKNNIRKMDSLLFDYELIRLKKDKTPITEKSYVDFNGESSMNYLTPWIIDAHCYAYSTLAKLIDRYILYCHNNKLEIRGNESHLEKIKYNLIEKYNCVARQKIDSRIQKNIEVFLEKKKQEYELVEKIKDNLYNGFLDVETLIIGEKIIDYLDENEIATLRVGYNEVAKRRYINIINMKDRSLEEICDYIINKKYTSRR